ncbi:MAG: MBL fold metallo-hydrolase [Candidatus Kapabacteria bacterium]|nr:MBL fold metallo-hydrolase [Candidatus Kapabacteria bacterium]
MKILYTTSGPVSTNGFLIYDENTLDGVIIDAPIGSFDFFIGEIEKKHINLNAIWLSHSHWDHTGDANKIHKFTKKPIYIHPLDEYRMIDPNKYLGFQLPFEIEPCFADAFFEENQILKVGNLEFELMLTPGHTEGSICFVNHLHKTVIVGDVLFKGSIGRTDLLGGNFEVLIESIRTKLLVLDDDFKVFNGHGDSTTIGNEKMFNPFLRDLN